MRPSLHEEKERLLVVRLKVLPWMDDFITFSIPNSTELAFFISRCPSMLSRLACTSNTRAKKSQSISSVLKAVFPMTPFSLLSYLPRHFYLHLFPDLKKPLFICRAEVVKRVGVCSEDSPHTPLTIKLFPQNSTALRSHENAKNLPLIIHYQCKCLSRIAMQSKIAQPLIPFHSCNS